MRVVAHAVVLLALALVALPVPAFAEALQWDGAADTSWFDPGIKKDTYEISTPEQLAGLAEILDPSNPTSEQSDHFYDTTFIQTADFSLAGHEWAPIRSFGGVYNGAGHAISDLTITDADAVRNAGGVGLFSEVMSSYGSNSAPDRRCGVQSLVLRDVAIDLPLNPQFHTGSVVAMLRDGAFVENCLVSGSLTCGADATGIIGGIVGLMDRGTAVLGCSSSLEISVDSHKADFGGVNVGGIIGNMTTGGSGDNEYPPMQVHDCYFSGSIHVDGPYAVVGGIVGAMDKYQAYATGVGVLGYCLVATDRISSTDATNTLAVVGTIIDVDAPYSTVYYVRDMFWQANEKMPALILADSAGTEHPAEQSDYGTAVTDLSDPALIEALNENSGVNWALGVNGHPVFEHETWKVAADYTSINAALAKIPDDLETAYLPEGVEAVKAAERAARDGLGMTVDRQDEVNRLARELEEALGNLVARTYDLRIGHIAPMNLTYGYALPEFTPLDIVNVGNSDATVASAVLRGDDAASFELQEPKDKVVPAAGGNTGWAVRPKAGLNAGIYEADFVVTYDGGAAAETRLCAVVAKATQDAPEDVKVRHEGVKGAKDGALLGLTSAMEWRPADGAWAAASSSSVTDLAPGTYEVRYAETENYEASETATLEIKAGSDEVEPPVGHDEPPAGQDEPSAGKDEPSADGKDADALPKTGDAASGLGVLLSVAFLLIALGIVRLRRS